VIDVMSAPAIAAAPKRRRSASDLRRLLPYVRPYRTRWIVMISAAIASLGAYRRV
jgi:ATP-binding cassette subfamily B protein